MAEPAPTPRLRRHDLILIVLFVFVLWLPTLDVIFGLDRSPAVNENRERARWPAFAGWAHTQGFIQGVQAYYDDHFGFRKRLVRWHSSWKRKMFGEAAVREVIIGQEGWLYTAANEMIENHTRLKRFSDEDLLAWQRLFETRRDWLAARGIEYLVAIAPDKQTIYPEYLPSWLKSGPGPSKLDQVLAHLQQHSSVALLDLRPALRAAKEHEPVFLMTDTHWNARGAFYAYQALGVALAQQLPNFVAWPREPLTWENTPGPGDLAIMLGQETSLAEKNRWVITSGMSPIQIERTSLSSAKRVAMTTTRYPAATGKAIVYHDSFGDSWIPFIAHNFAEVIYIAKRPIDPSFIEAQQPLIVIDQIVERILNVKDPRALLAEDGIAGESNPPNRLHAQAHTPAP